MTAPMQGIVRMKEIANRFLNGEIDGIGFWEARQDLFESVDWNLECEIWLATRILGTGEPGIVS